jgi:hypothetical protein
LDVAGLRLCAAVAAGASGDFRLRANIISQYWCATVGSSFFRQ